MMKKFNLLSYTAFFILLMSCNMAAGQDIKASFDCNKASQPIEKSICADVDLAKLDKQLAGVYKNVRKHVSRQEKSALKAMQKSWLWSRVVDCQINSKTYAARNTISCLKKTYLSRIKALKLMIVAEAAFYRASIKQEKFSLEDRKKWQALVKWPNACEFDRLNFLSNYGYGLKVSLLTQNTYLLSVMCDMYAYQSVYELYLINFTDKDIKTSLLKLPQPRYVKNRWKFIPARKITGHVQFYPKDKTLLTERKHSGAGQCGHSVIYQLNAGETDHGKFARIKKAWGNDDCEKSMTPDDWPEIKLP